MRDDKQGNEAWVGDAVLALFAREWILKDPSITPKERAVAFKNMTSNQFLSSVGEPTAMEARIGRVYEAQGLQAAFDHIEATFVPVFKKQQAKARRPGAAGAKTSKRRSIPGSGRARSST